MNSSSGRFASAKNLQPARSLRSQQVQNRNGPGNFGLVIVPDQQQPQNGGAGNGGPRVAFANGSANYYGTMSPSKTSTAGAQYRRHDVLRSPNTSFGSSSSSKGSNSSGRSNSSGKDVHTIVTFSSTSLAVNSTHEVYVAYIENGPKLFTIQVKATEGSLNTMMDALGRVRLRTLSHRPSVGMACIARYSQDNCLYRALIMAIEADSCVVTYVDYGNKEHVPLDALYEIPQEFLKHKVFSMRFTLSKVKALEDTNADISGLFAELVLNRVLTMKVMPLEGPAFVQYCELYEAGSNIFDKLLALCKANPLQYPPGITFERGTSCMIIIRYIESCKQFYVQPVENVERFERLMDQLAEHCRKSTSQQLDLSAWKEGDPCAACLSDTECYRAALVAVIGSSKVKVCLVDYGNTMTLDKSQIKRLAPNFVQHPPQVVECCLEGFQDLTNISLSTDQLEILAENDHGNRMQFKLVVTEITNGKTIVNLLDETATPVLNVAKRLLKLKNPAKFVKEQQMQQQQQQQAAQQKQNSLSNNRHQQQATTQPMKHSQPSMVQQHLPAVVGPVVGSRNPFHTSGGAATAISEGTGHASSAFVGASRKPVNYPAPVEPEIIDLTQDDIVVSSHRGGASARGREHTNSYRSDAASVSSHSNSSFHGSSGSATGGKKERVPRPDIPRFNKQERSYIPSYIEHDDRCESTNNYDGNRQQQTSLATGSRNRDKPVIQKGTANGGGGGGGSGSSVSGSESGYQTQTTVVAAAAAATEPVVYVPFEHQLGEQEVPLQTKVEIKLNLWVSPEEFYVRIKGPDEERFDEMMKQLQKFYRQKSPLSEEMSASSMPTVHVGATLVVRSAKNSTLYRARVLKLNESLGKYKVELVDFGTRIIVTSGELWRLEKRFTVLPKMGIQCTLANIKLNCGVKELQAKIDKYVSPEQCIECTFLERSDDKYVCEVESAGVDLRMALWKDNLVRQILTDIDVQRLKGQTLKLKLVEMRDLSAFRVQLHGHDSLFNCRHVVPYHGGGGSDEASLVDEIRSKWLHHSCYGTIEDVSSDEWLILALLVPPLATQTPPVIVSMPILRDSFTGMVTYVEEENCVYVQNSRWTTEADALLTEMFDYYEKSAAENSITQKELANLQIDELCAVKTADGNWYRARIIALRGLDDIDVRLVDYGNRERGLKHTDLRPLAEDRFREHSAFAHRVYLPMGVLSESIDADALKLEIAQLTGGYELEIKILAHRGDIWIVDITSNDYSIVQVLKDKQLVKAVELEEILNQQMMAKTAAIPSGVAAVNSFPSGVEQPSSTEADQREQQIASPSGSICSERVRAIISHVDSPGQLFIQLASDQDELGQLQENLQIIAEALPQLKDFSVGRYCVAPYSADDLWYRARIIDSHEDLIIQFVDYGNSDVITSNKKSELREVNESLMSSYKIYARRCSLLAGPPPGRKNWTEGATAKFRELTNNYADMVDVRFLVEAKSGINYINLWTITSESEHEIAEQLIASELATRLQYVPSGQRCFTSHIESLAEFYLQLERDINPLDVMADYMARFEEFPVLAAGNDLPPPASGTVCCALFSDDGLWYRAKVLSSDESSVEVFFMDYGNTCRIQLGSELLRELEPAIAELPPLCTKCALRLPEGVQAWSDQAEANFRELAANGETVFTVKLHAPGAVVAVVDLFPLGSSSDGEGSQSGAAVSVSEQLMELCEKGSTALAGGEESTAVAAAMNSSFYLSDERTLDDSSYPLEGFVFVVHVNSPADFYIHFKNTFDALKNMEELLMSKAAQCERLTDDEIYEGMFCLAYLVSYDKYYRAQVISSASSSTSASSTFNHHHHHQYKVLLIDYGFTSFATDLRKMPAGIEEISLLAKKCCLETYTPDDPNVLEVVKKRFAVLADSGRTQFSFEIVKNDSEPTIIRLFTHPDGQNVEDLLEYESAKHYDQTNKSTLNNSIISSSSGSSNGNNTHKPGLSSTSTNSIDTSKGGTIQKAVTRAKPKQAFFRAKSDLDFEQS